MKYIFLAALLMLLIASAFTALTAPQSLAGKPVLYWTTDANPARIEQIRLFERWLVSNGHVAANGTAAVQLRLDTANNDPTKKIIQSVSGVAGDLLDMGGGDIRFLQSMGVLADVTEDAAALGFDASHTYAAAREEIAAGDRQYAFPCNVTAHAYWVNNEVFRIAGVKGPIWRWTLDDFERIGKELRDKANAGRPRPEVFLASGIDITVIARSLGLDLYNETMTRCTLDDPRYVRLLERIRRWTYVDHILPRPDDVEGLSTQQAGYGGNAFQLLNRGNYAMVLSGRYALIQFREFNEARRLRGQPPMNLSVVEPPHGGFPNTGIMARATAVFRGSPHPEYARLFLAFLASEVYNMQIVADGDSLPPDPQYARTEAFAHPTKYPEEWSVHEPWAKLAETIAIPTSYSPFVALRVASRIQLEQFNAYMAGRCTAEEGARRTARGINAEIELRLSEDPALRPSYNQLLSNQKRIDDLRQRGEIVPLELITNPFHRRYYVEKGWAK